MVYFKIKSIISAYWIFLLIATSCFAGEIHLVTDNESLKLISGCEPKNRLLLLSDINLSSEQEEQTLGMERKKPNTSYYDIAYKTMGSGIPRKVEICLYGKNIKFNDDSLSKLTDFIQYSDTDVLKIYYLTRGEFKYLVAESRPIGASGLMMSYHSFFVVNLLKGTSINDEIYSTVYYNPFYFSIKKDGTLEAILLNFELTNDGERSYYAIRKLYSD